LIEELKKLKSGTKDKLQKSINAIKGVELDAKTEIKNHYF